MKKREYPLQKIKENLPRVCLYRQKGGLTWVPGMFFLLFLVVLLSAEFWIIRYKTTAMYLEDALAASNLASAIVDVEEYGKSHRVVIRDPQNSYEIYCRALKENLHLNDEWECANKELIAGPVSLDLYVIYNVTPEKITAYRVFSGGLIWQWEEKPGDAFSPNGLPIESTAVYSEISFPVWAPFSGLEWARKGKLVDIVRGN